MHDIAQKLDKSNAAVYMSPGLQLSFSSFDEGQLFFFSVPVNVDIGAIHPFENCDRSIYVPGAVISDLAILAPDCAGIPKGIVFFNNRITAPNTVAFTVHNFTDQSIIVPPKKWVCVLIRTMRIYEG